MQRKISIQDIKDVLPFFRMRYPEDEAELNDISTLNLVNQALIRHEVRKIVESENIDKMKLTNKLIGNRLFGSHKTMQKTLSTGSHVNFRTE